MYRTSKLVLDNGLRVVCVELPHLHTVALTLAIRTGSRHETPETNGISHFLEHMLFRGTERYPTSYDLNHAIECLGSTMDAVTSRDLTELSMGIFPENLVPALELLAEIVTRSRFSEIDVERQVILEELAEEVDEDGRIIDIDQIAKRTLWPTSPLGLGIAGTPETVRRITVDDLRRHHRDHYVGRNMVLTVAGPVVEAEVVRVARASFGGIPAGEPAHESSPEPGRPLPHLVTIKHAGSQTELQASFVAFPEADPDAVPLQVLMRVLDDGIAARLQRRICDELGIAYAVGASLELYKDTGLLLVEGTVRHEKVPQLLREFGRTLAELRTTRLPPAELRRARERYRWSLLQRLDSADAMASWFGPAELFTTPEALEARLERVNRVTEDDLLRVARRVLRSDGLLVTAVGSLGRTLLARTREAFASLGEMLAPGVQGPAQK